MVRGRHIEIAVVLGFRGKQQDVVGVGRIGSDGPWTLKLDENLLSALFRRKRGLPDGVMGDDHEGRECSSTGQRGR